jgi:hypothetical protein
MSPLTDLFREVEFYQVRKATERTAGDAFMVHRERDEDRIIGVLSDGLGSGVKANILANMTAQMALKFAASDTDFLHYAQVIMNALPVCQVRKIAYATFTVLDARSDGMMQVVEQGNPPFVLLRKGRPVELEPEEFAGEQGDYRKLRVYRFRVHPEDRVVCFSDGVTEAGMGTPRYPLGWRRAGCAAYAAGLIEADAAISARTLARCLVKEALQKEPDRRAYDDMSCCVLYFWSPRRTLLASGPPFSEKKDAEYAETIRAYEGKKVISGGTSADIVARELGRGITTDLRLYRRSNLPPISQMAGVDLITEGILTLTETLNVLEGKRAGESENAATRLAELLRDSDVIDLLVGTRINQAHQDPNLPVELEIRRSLMRRIATVLEERFLKQVNMEFI